MPAIQHRIYEIYEIPSEIFFRILAPLPVGEEPPQGGFFYYDVRNERGFYSPTRREDEYLANVPWDVLGGWPKDENEFNLTGLSADMFEVALHLADLMEGEEWTQETLENSWAVLVQKSQIARELPSEVIPEVEELAFYMLHKAVCPCCGAILEKAIEGCPCGGDPQWHKEGFKEVKTEIIRNSRREP